MKAFLLLIGVVFIYSASRAAGGTFSRDPASAADDLASDTVADERPSDYEAATHVITVNLKPFQACFNAEVQKHPGLSGHVTIQWRIKPNGDATDARLGKSDIKTPTFAACMRAEIMKLKFDPPSPKTAQPFTYPFVFYSDKTQKQY